MDDLCSGPGKELWFASLMVPVKERSLSTCKVIDVNGDRLNNKRETIDSSINIIEELVLELNIGVASEYF